MRNSTLLLGEFLWGSPYRLDILTIILKKIFNQIFFRVFRVFRGLLSSDHRRNLYGNKIFKRILIENALFLRVLP